MHQGGLLGAISIRMPRAEPLRPAGEHLVADLASQAGLVLANAGLIEDLRASRQRLAAAQDEARRRLERNIHDGAQQDLVALIIKLGLAAVTLDEDPAETTDVLRELRADAEGALTNLRDLARGIYPPLLADMGLVPALSAQASKFPFPVTVQAEEIGRSSQDAEAAVYFCCLEALQNVSKYAKATTACVTLQAQNGPCASPRPTTGPATTPATPRWDRACGTWPTGSRRLAASLTSSPRPAWARRSPGGCLPTADGGLQLPDLALRPPFGSTPTKRPQARPLPLAPLWCRLPAHPGHAAPRPHRARPSVCWTKSTSTDRGWNESALSAAPASTGDAPDTNLNR